MGVRLSALPDYLARWDVPFSLVDGWQTRSRASGDFVDVMAVGVHHTASYTSPDRDQAWCIDNSGDRPIGNGLLCRDGTFRLWSVRATNTQGKGGPYLTSRGVIPADSGNSRIFAIEAANAGTGEPWPDVMIESYLLICCAVIDCVNDTTPGVPLGAGDVLAHFEWAPGRKFDPAGQCAYATGAALWDMDAYRGDIYNRLNPQEDEMALSDEDVQRIADAVWQKAVRNQVADEDQPAGQLLGWTHLEAYNAAHD